MDVQEEVTLLYFNDLYPDCDDMHSLIFGMITPIQAALVTVANIFIVILFTKPNIRSRTTCILTLIALADVLSILSPTSIYIWLFTLDNGNHRAVPYRFCIWTIAFVDIFLDMFNSMSLWFTVLLALMRRKCLQSPFTAKCTHRYRHVIGYITGVVCLVLAVHIPSFFIFDVVPLNRTYVDSNVTGVMCGLKERKYSIPRKIHLWMEVLLDSLIPSCILLYLTFSILWVLRKAKQSRSSLRSHSSVYRPGGVPDDRENEGVSVRLKYVQFRRWKFRAQTSKCSVDSAFEKLDRESRRTSWLIFAVAILISTHELPMALISAYKLTVHMHETLPLVFFGCWSAIFTLWQNTIYPLTFFIYALMSANFRSEILRVLTCKCLFSGEETTAGNEPIVKKVLLSPCSVRKSLSKGLSKANEETVGLSSEN
ncbi:G-protein coupled receptor dmsr-1-like [Mya arenaria]|uniref:G-protein coupled receptor dmsr-1-like n=1 Tax=Mya arenaria TaxID=6604 RepID=UPI0022E62851|nr:G-protein coupled receptor dmsr-1-like [Mya arenaria]